MSAVGTYTSFLLILRVDRLRLTTKAGNQSQRRKHSFFEVSLHAAWDV